MPLADIIDPLGGDTVTVAYNGQITVTVFYNYPLPPKTLQCFVDTDSDAATVPPGRIGTHYGIVTCSKGIGTYNNVPVKTTTNGAPDDQELVTLEVTASLVKAPKLEQTLPAPPAALPLPGAGAIEYLVSGDLVGGAAYVVTVAIEIAAGGVRTPLNGVCAMPLVPGTYAVAVRIPNNPDCAYVARIMHFDANDVVIRRETVVLKSP